MNVHKLSAVLFSTYHILQWKRRRTKCTDKATGRGQHRLHWRKTQYVQIHSITTWEDWKRSRIDLCELRHCVGAHPLWALSAGEGKTQLSQHTSWPDGSHLPPNTSELAPTNPSQTQTGWYSIYLPQGTEGWVDLGGWLHIPRSQPPTAW